MLNTSPGSHSTNTSKGRQQISQSVVNCCVATLVSMASSKLCPQNGHETLSVACMTWRGLKPRLRSRGNDNRDTEFRVAIGRDSS